MSNTILPSRRATEPYFVSEPYANPTDSVSSIDSSHSTSHRSATLPQPHAYAWQDTKPDTSTWSIKPHQVPMHVPSRTGSIALPLDIEYCESTHSKHSIMVRNALADPTWRRVWFPLRFLHHYLVATLLIFVGSLLAFALALPWITAVRRDWNVLPGWPVPHIFAAHAIGAVVLGAPAAASGMFFRLLAVRYRAPAWSFRLDSPLKFTMVVALICTIFGLQAGVGVAPHFAPGGERNTGLMGIGLLGFLTGLGLYLPGFVVWAIYTDWW